MKKSALLSECRQYRYDLWRIWDDQLGYALFIGLNPSTADETEDDPTIRRCIEFSRDWGYGGLCMVNLFAYRATKPSDMKSSLNPVGLDNNKWLSDHSRNADIIIGAWGNHGIFNGRSGEVKKLLPQLKCLKLNKSGEPAHPLYQPRSAIPILL